MLSAQLAKRGILIAASDWNLDRLPDHLKPTYQIVSGTGSVLAAGKDLAALRGQFAHRLATAVADAASDLTRGDVRTWDLGELPRTVQVEVGGHRVTGYPALVAEEDRVALRVLDSEVAQRVAMRAGLRRLLILGLPNPAKRLRDGLTPQQRLALSQTPHSSAGALLSDCTEAAVDSLIRAHGGPVWDEASFQRLRGAVEKDLAKTAETVFSAAVAALADARAVQLALTQASASIATVIEEVQRNYDELIHPGFVTATGAERLPSLRRYLQALAVRLSDAPANRDRDESRQEQVRVVEQDLAELTHRLAERGPFDPELVEEFRWMVQELRVSLFAQRLGTAGPVSVARIQAAMGSPGPCVTSSRRWPDRHGPRT